MPAKFPFDFECEECGAVLEALLNSFHVDLREVRHRLRETADATGRSIEEMRDAWVSSVAKMAPDEKQTLLRAHYPRCADARRKKAEHEALTGHSVHTHGWSKVFGRRAFGGRPPGGQFPS